VAERAQAAFVFDADEAPESAASHVLEEDPLDRILGTEIEDSLEVGAIDDPSHADIVWRVKVSAVPIHLRGAPGDYAEACLLPGDPLRARWIAERFFDDLRQVNAERGLLGYTGAFEGKPVSIQTTGMGTPSTAIVVEELLMLGVTRLLRVGTCGAVAQTLSLGDLVLALSAVPADGTTGRYVEGEPHAPTADWELLHGAVHAAKELGYPLKVGPIASSDTFYDPDADRHGRWARRGVLAVDMESSTLFTIAAVRGVQAGCLLAVSDLVAPDSDHVRIGDAELAQAVERMAELALRAIVSSSRG
jgi:purine-nucleoside phosphorylase